MRWVRPIVFMRWTSLAMLSISCAALAGEAEETILETYQGDDVSFRTFADTGRVLPSLPQPGVFVLRVYEITLGDDADELWKRLARSEQVRILKDPKTASESKAKEAAFAFWKSAFASRLIMITSVEHSKERATVAAKLYELNDNSGRQMTIKLAREGKRWVISGKPEHWLGSRKVEH